MIYEILQDFFAIAACFYLGLFLENNNNATKSLFNMLLIVYYPIMINEGIMSSDVHHIHMSATPSKNEVSEFQNNYFLLPWKILEEISR